MSLFFGGWKLGSIEAFQFISSPHLARVEFSLAFFGAKALVSPHLSRRGMQAQSAWTCAPLAPLRGAKLSPPPTSRHFLFPPDFSFFFHPDDLPPTGTSFISLFAPSFLNQREWYHCRKDSSTVVVSFGAVVECTKCICCPWWWR